MVPGKFLMGTGRCQIFIESFQTMTGRCQIMSDGVRKVSYGVRKVAYGVREEGVRLCPKDVRKV